MARPSIIKTINLVAVMLAVLLLSVTASFAAEQNSVRFGDDYKIFNMEEGANYRRCERRCEKETKCRAWTFIRERVKHRKGLSFNLGKGFSFNLGDDHEDIIPAQCRLKFTVGSAVKNKCCVSGVVRDMDKRDRGEEDRCSRLSSVAVRQNDRNLRRRCGYRGWLWNANYSFHYDRCIRKGSDRIKRHIRKRREKLQQCRRGGRRNRKCLDFADTVVSLNETNAKNECGLKGDVWSSDFDSHYDHCRKGHGGGRDDRNQLVNQREKIQACLARGGGAFSQKCDDFAKTAVRQQKENLKEGCRFAGTRWHKNYRRHYQACRKISSWRRFREAASRKNALKRCVREAGDRRDVCDGFADKAMKSQRENARIGCNFTRKTRWHLNRRKHIRFCEGLSGRERRSEIRQKEDALATCRRKHSVDDVRDEFCRDYAEVAIEQNRRNIRKGCGYRTTLWSDRYRDHYVWCLKNPERSSRRDRRERRDLLQDCRSDSRGDRRDDGDDRRRFRDKAKKGIDLLNKLFR